MNEMTSLQRVLTTLGHKEPDRVPLFLLLTMHGAKELNISIEEYFSKAQNVVDGQLILRQKYNNDCIYTFFYAGVETEAMGGKIVYSKDGPPNAGAPIIKDFKDIENLKEVDIQASPSLLKVLEATRKLKKEVQDDVPIIGVVISPFSLPIMQLGFDKYLDLIYEHPILFNKLMKYNEEFCVSWANAQYDAGATAICYFDPLSSPTMIPRELFQKTGYEIGKRVLSKFKGAAAIHLASGLTTAISEEITTIGAGVVGVSTNELSIDLIRSYKGKISILGNLNGIEMRKWTIQDAHDSVKKVIKELAPGGGFILSDNHGEIPFQISDEILLAISNAVRMYGKYPINLG